MKKSKDHICFGWYDAINDGVEFKQELELITLNDEIYMAMIEEPMKKSDSNRFSKYISDKTSFYGRDLEWYKRAYNLNLETVKA